MIFILLIFMVTEIFSSCMETLDDPTALTVEDKHIAMTMNDIRYRLRFNMTYLAPFSWYILTFESHINTNGLEKRNLKTFF